MSSIVTSIKGVSHEIGNDIDYVQSVPYPMCSRIPECHQIWEYSNNTIKALVHTPKTKLDTSHQFHTTFVSVRSALYMAF